MWKMFDEDILDCSECGSPLGPPPKFMIPPPPRPPSMADYGLSSCNEEELALKAQQAWDSDMCEAIPILDASLYSSQSLQTSAMIAVFSLLLVLVVLISSLFVWKNKRKVQNFLPCKTPTRGPHINGGLPLGGAHAHVTYEDPDAHLGHRPLVMRHHHNVELIHGKGIHYPSGYPMTRSPPFLVSSSPGPDPYRSNDNVYEELGPGRDSDGESEPPLHSDDDFAEDELSLPGERSFNKPEVPPALPAGVSTIFHERAAAGGVAAVSGTLPERNSLLSSSSSTHDASTATAASSNSSHNNNSSHSKAGNCSGGAAASGRSGGGLLSGMLRHTTGRSRAQKSSQKTANADELNTSTSTTATADADVTPIQQLYDNRSNLMSLSYVPPPHAHHTPQAPPHFHSLHHVHHSGTSNKGSAVRSSPQFYNTLESEVERRNRINAQLSRAPAPVATIFRERIHYPGSGRYPQTYYAPNSSSGSSSILGSSLRARTNPRSMERRHRVAAPVELIEPAYAYAEPVYHHNYHYESCGAPSAARVAPQQQQALVYPTGYVLPAYTSGSYRSHHHPASASSSSNASTTYQNAAQLYARGGDSSFGSDSGYSHHTPASSIGRHDYDIAMPMPVARTTPKSGSKLGSALSFGWNRRKSTPSSTSADLSAPHKAAAAVAAELSATTPTTSASGTDNASASSPNNNSGSSTVTTSLETSEHSGRGATTHQNNSNNNNSGSLCAAHAQQA